MNWIAAAALALQILLLLCVAVIDIATRLIQNEICLTLALLGVFVAQLRLRCPQPCILEEGLRSC
jgi:prepilin signal peptidase PulO-like enzyme (type II secretory pathway)